MFTANGSFFYVPLLAPMVGAIVGGGFFKVFVNLSDDDGIDNCRSSSPVADERERERETAKAARDKKSDNKGSARGDRAVIVVNEEELELGVAGTSGKEERRGGGGHKESAAGKSSDQAPSPSPCKIPSFFLRRVDKTRRAADSKLGRRTETIVNLAIEEGSLRRERSIQNLVTQ